ncbi:hypothetical protein BDC45DRAFT_538021 [Circinella umbellata]|nr:hypothetical protein BDC45DRAFT_538021 [Circinella umbellata]
MPRTILSRCNKCKLYWKKTVLQQHYSTCGNILFIPMKTPKSISTEKILNIILMLSELYQEITSLIPKFCPKLLPPPQQFHSLYLGLLIFQWIAILNKIMNQWVHSEATLMISTLVLMVIVVKSMNKEQTLMKIMIM